MRPVINGNLVQKMSYTAVIKMSRDSSLMNVCWEAFHYMVVIND